MLCKLSVQAAAAVVVGRPLVWLVPSSYNLAGVACRMDCDRSNASR